MKLRRRAVGPTIRAEGALLPVDLLARIAATDASLPGMAADDYHLVRGTRFGEGITASWNRLVGAWEGLRQTLPSITAADPAMRLTRERWLLPLFVELGFGRLAPTPVVELGERRYAVSHAWGDVPIHLVGWNVPLDRRTERVPGAATQSPHGLVQELLNRSPARLWGLVSNGRVVRLLRDNAALTRQSYIEFDLETMFDTEEYSDFALLWLLCHQSRFEGAAPEQWLVEQWSQLGAETGTRALKHLRQGVAKAVAELGSGFISHPSNQELRGDLSTGRLSAMDLYRELLRLVYRLIFLFAAEDRGLLLDPTASPEAKQRFADYYSTARLRRLAERFRGSRHSDLWVALRTVTRTLGSDTGERALALPALGSLLFSAGSTPSLEQAQLTNAALLNAVRELATVEDGDVLRSVDYRNLGSEELGGVYESLLELHPQVDAIAQTFELSTAAGSERKTTGSYYTPASLISALLDSALDPVIAEAASKPTQEQAEAALLAVKIVDPAAGSGHFLIAAAHRLAQRLAIVRTGDDEPAPMEVRHALHDVIRHCVYAVDRNELAVELCKVSLWLEALEPGRPLSYLDIHVRHGNSLIGTVPALLAGGIPDGAYDAIEGDDKQTARALRRRNRQERDSGQLGLGEGDIRTLWADLVVQSRKIAAIDDSSPLHVVEIESQHRALISSSAYEKARLEADAWCAAFFVPKVPGSVEITQQSLRAIQDEAASQELAERVVALRAQHGFFHWHLEFPDVFEPGGVHDGPGWRGGFSVVLGNPPWERVKLSEKEFFAKRDFRIAEASIAASRQQLISNLQNNDAALYAEYRDAIRAAEAESHFLRHSGRYPLSGRGDVNTYAVFAETMVSLIAPIGRVGVIVPTGIATDDTTKELFGDFVTRRVLASLYDFVNGRIFPDVHAQQKFCLLTVSGAARPVEAPRFVFFAAHAGDLADQQRAFTLAPEDMALMNPNTRTAPIFRSRRDAELTKRLYQQTPVLVHEGSGADGNRWGVSFAAMFHMTNDSHLFRTRAQLDQQGAFLDGNIFTSGDQLYLPLYEAKMIQQFDHRSGDFGMQQPDSRSTRLPDVPEDLYARPEWEPLPRYWVTHKSVDEALSAHPEPDWLMGWRDFTGNTNERTLILCVIPRVAAGNTLPLIFPEADAGPACLLACLNSFVVDYIARGKSSGTHVNFFALRQIAVLPPAIFLSNRSWLGSVEHWVTQRVLELMFTSWSLQGFAKDHGYGGPPFRWDRERRLSLRCELDALFFHLYEVGREDVSYILDAFPVVRRNDERTFGEYRTKRLILERYDDMASAIAADTLYRTVLEPPPADPRVAHAHSEARVVRFPLRALGDAQARYAEEQLQLPRIAEDAVEYGAAPRRRGRRGTRRGS